MRGRLAVVGLGAIGLMLASASAAAAHPLGNFTVNHYHGLQFDPEGLTDSAVLDSAEIPTAQAASDVDGNGDGRADDAERARYAHNRCGDLARGLGVSSASENVPMRVVSSVFDYRPGQAGLDVSRLECELRGDFDLRSATTVEFRDGFESGRVGWREITAVADGVHLNASPVPADSITDALASYPNDLLSSPLDVRQVSIEVRPGRGESTVADSIATATKAGPFTRVVDRVTDTFNGLVGRDRLTLGVGLLAIGLALLLGASHALLPGHGKTVMAAYIAGSQGSMRDAVMVGATVTATHTAGVVVLGLALTLSSSLAGDAVLRWLGVSSGLLVAALGVSLLVNAIRHRVPAHDHHHGIGGHSHSHSPVPSHAPELVSAGGGSDRGRQGSALDDDPHVHDDNGHRDDTPGNHHHDGHAHHNDAQAHHDGHSQAEDSHAHSDGHHEQFVNGESRESSRRRLVAMGVAGGLVPSPSALVVLLAAIALGRTIFGVVLVVAYGLGMAATLTATGLVLVKLRDRFQGRAAERLSRRFAIGWTRLIPYTTASIVMVVGFLLATRSLVGPS